MRLKKNVRSSNFIIKNIHFGSSNSFLILSIIFFVISVNTSTAAEIKIEPSFQVIEPGKEFTINVSIDPGGIPITGAQFNLIYNSSMIDIIDVSEGDLFRQNGSATWFYSGNISQGILFNVLDVIITPGGNVSKKANISMITLYAKKNGRSYLNLSHVVISDPESKAVRVNITNGSARIRNEVRPPSSGMTYKYIISRF